MSRDKSRTEIPPEAVERYDRLVRERPHFERKGVGLPYTSVNGHMFTFLAADGTMGLRLPTDQREAFLKQWDTSLFVAHGAVLKEYVVVPDRLFQNTGELLNYLDMSYRYVVGLKPKKPRTPAARKPGGARKAGGAGRPGSAPSQGGTGKARKPGGARKARGTPGPERSS